MILVTGATGTVGKALVKRLVEAGDSVRVFVRDPRRLGPVRSDVSVVMGDLSDPRSFRNALRGVDTVVHLAAAIRDQPGATIERANALATLSLVRLAERAGVERFVFFTALNATAASRSRFMRSKALAEAVVSQSPIESTVFAASIIYTPGDPWTDLLRALSQLPMMPVIGDGRSRFQPIWGDDVARCVQASLSGQESGVRDSRYRSRRIELGGPEILTHDQLIDAVVAGGTQSPPPHLHVPLALVKGSLRALERAVGPNVFATWEEAELMEISMVPARGAADVEALGVSPKSVMEVMAGGG